MIGAAARQPQIRLTSGRRRAESPANVVSATPMQKLHSSRFGAIRAPFLVVFAGVFAVFLAARLSQSLAADFRKPFTIALLGSDARSPNEPGRADTIVVLQFDPAARRVRGLTLPRDLYVKLSGLPVKRTGRLNSVLFYGDYYGGRQGLHAARATLADILDTRVDGAVAVRFDFIREVADLLGGLDVYCEQPLVDAYSTDSARRSRRPSFHRGWNHLAGKRALDFVRMRRPDMDFGRMERNRVFLDAVVRRLHTPEGLRRLPAMMAAILRQTDSDLSPADWLRAALAFRRCADRPIEWNAITFEDTIPHTMPQGAKVLLPEPGLLETAGLKLNGRLPARYAHTVLNSGTPRVQ